MINVNQSSLGITLRLLRRIISLMKYMKDIDKDLLDSCIKTYEYLKTFKKEETV